MKIDKRKVIYDENDTVNEFLLYIATVYGSLNTRNTDCDPFDRLLDWISGKWVLKLQETG